MRLVIATLVLLGAAAPLGADVSAPGPAGLRWRLDAAAAEREAAKAHRPLVIFFSAEWCMPCKEMLVKSFADPAVAELIARRFVPLLVDVTNDDAPSAALRDRFHVLALPTLLVRRGGDERLRQESYLPAAELKAALERAAK
ncbi:MAG: thioredoxin family protein [Polyangia bacterium]